MTGTPLLALALGAEKLAAFGIKCLAVAGGFLVGYAAGGLLAWGLNRWVFAEKAPELVRRGVRLLSGVALAILVALIVFGEGGGGGLFGGGGGTDGDGKGAPRSEDKGKDTNPPAVRPDEKVTPVTPAKPGDSRPAEVTIRVTILGGPDVRDNRFYLVDDDPSPKTFAELKSVVTGKKEADKRKAALAIVFPEKNQLPEDHPAVTQVKRWARDEAGLDVTFPAR